MEINQQLNQSISSIQPKLNSALASITRQEVNLSLKECSISSLSAVHSMVGDQQSNVTTIYIPIMGDVTGDIFLFLNTDSAAKIADLMIGNEPGTTQILTDFEQSALKEMGNITTGVIVTALANATGLSMMLTTPNLATDMATALVDQVLIEYGEAADDLLVIDYPFIIEGIEAQGNFLLLFDKDSSATISNSMKSA